MQMFQWRIASLRVFRFLMSGGINTSFTYCIYIFLLNFFTYQKSYAIAFACGVGLAFVLGKFFVFKSHRGIRSIVLFPFVYLAQYLVGAGVLWLWVGQLGFDEDFAPLVAIAITVPVTYVLSFYVFVEDSRAG